MVQSDDPGDGTVDVAIVGAGILGLFNALSFAKRGLRVALLDNVHQRRSYKVGESLLNFSNAFLRTIAELDEFLTDASFPKHGIWFSHGVEHAVDFAAANECAFEGRIPARWVDAIVDNRFARTMFIDKQIVRPEAEDRMRETVRRLSNVRFIDDVHVTNVVLGSNGDSHTVAWKSQVTSGSGELKCRWVLDCSGRRRLLARQFGHDMPLGDDFQTTAVWGQFRDATDDRFDSRWEYIFPEGVPERRDRNTCHLWGDGYWMWVIRLSGDRVSIGVTWDQAKAPPGADYRERFWNVVKRYPLLVDVATPDKLLEMRTYRDVQYISDTYVSDRRYAMVGDAASIIDAYYSQGISLALVTSWHCANIIERDTKHAELDRKYIRRVNDHTLSDWILMRSMVQSKYTNAIEDSRFFLLSHLIDYAIFGAAFYGRFRLARWLYLTGGYTDRETAVTVAHRRWLGRNLYLSRAFPMSCLPSRTIARLAVRCQDRLAKRAQWRMANGIRLAQLRSIGRTTAPLPAVWRLLFARNENKDISLTEHVEPSWVRIRGTEDRPLTLWAVGPMLFFLIVFGYLFDAVDTFLRRLSVGLARGSMSDPEAVVAPGEAPSRADRQP